MSAKSKKTLIGQIREVFQSMRENADFISPSFEAKEDENAAIDLMEYEAEIAGIADRISRGYSLTLEDKRRLEIPILKGSKLRATPDSSWPDRTEHEIAHLGKVLAQAQTLERLRQLCLEQCGKGETGRR